MRRALLRAVTLAVSLICSSCNGLFYYPSRTMIRTPADAGLTFETVTISAPGEATLRGWFLPNVGKTRGTVLFLHGNAENISTHLYAVHWLPAEGYQVFLIDYQGYGESGGTATVAALHNDVRRMIRYVSARPEVRHERLFLMGQSLGATMALYTAAQPEFGDTFRAIIADSPFASYREIVREKIAAWWLISPLQWPLSWLVDDRYAPATLLESIATPVLLVHGASDDAVPAQHSRDLCAGLAERCTLWIVAECGHTAALHALEYRRRLVEFLDSR